MPLHKVAHEVLGTNWPPLDDKGVMKRSCKNEQYLFVDFFAHSIGMPILKREEKKEEILLKITENVFESICF